MDLELKEKINNWLKWDKNNTTKSEIEDLVKNNEIEALRKCLLKRMVFGTAGLRARMGAGNNSMNELTIIQTTQGFAKYLELKFGAQLKTSGIVIGFDSRHNSKRFANLICNVFTFLGVKVFLFSKITPTPFVPFAITHYGACAGVMVTASHNPKQDNGYKVYWKNGSQIIPPHDTGISDLIQTNLAPWSEVLWSRDLKKDLVQDPFDEVFKIYFEKLKKLSGYQDTNGSSSIRFVYTPVHGVGLDFAIEAFRVFNLKPFYAVAKQQFPDPEFPTVEYPNPEEGAGVLHLSMATGDENNCDVILANDPDADRLAIAEKTKSGHWRAFNGNEIGALLGWWCWKRFRDSNRDFKKEDVWMLSSTVSSKILQSISKVEGFSFEDTLTGFKWMGNRADEIITSGKQVLFAFEEAIGFMIGSNVLDKDGISALAVASELVCYLKKENLNLAQKLDQIYEKYGQHVTNNSYVISRDSQKTSQMFQRLRNFQHGNSPTSRYPKNLGRFQINAIRDVTTGFDSRTSNQQSNLPKTPGSEMLTFYFDNEAVVTLRTSGTEPKIKYYSEICKKGNRAELVEELKELIDLMIKEFIQPKLNGFETRT